MNLQKYLEQLIIDINTAIKNFPAPSAIWETDAEQSVDRLSLLADNTDGPTRPLEEWCGIKKEQLPPDSSLSDQQITQLLTNIKQLLDTYNCSAVFQIKVPERMQYRVIRAQFHQEVPIQKNDYFFFNFCDKLASRQECILSEQYCHCTFFENFFKKFGQQQEIEENEEEEGYIDTFREYILKKRYGADWFKYLYSDRDDGENDEK